jgi:hypothetical protein
LCSALQHILRATSKCEDVAFKFTGAIIPFEEILAINSERLSQKQKTCGKSVRYEWMQEFYKIRNDFAHGKLSTQKPSTWNTFEHLFLATIAFPLIVKSLLVQAGKYVLTDDDKTQIDVFEKFVDTPNFGMPSPDEKHKFPWIRLILEYGWKVLTRSLVINWSKLPQEQLNESIKKSDSDC